MVEDRETIGELEPPWTARTDNSDVTQPPNKARRILSVQPRTSEANGVGRTGLWTVTARRTSSLPHSNSANARVCARGKLDGKRDYKGNTARTRARTAVTHRTRPSMRGKCSHTGRRQQPKRKHCECVSATQVDTDDPDQRHMTEHHCAVGGRQEEVWNRWRRLESRKKRRT
jgi:hypothetical protein